MAIVLAAGMIAAGGVVIVFRDRLAADNAHWQLPFLPQLSSARRVTLAGFGFGLFGLLIVLAGFGVLATALHFSRALP